MHSTMHDNHSHTPTSLVHSHAILTRELYLESLSSYLPPSTDTRTHRPAAVLVHGGSFISGNSRSDEEPTLAYELVTRGYVRHISVMRIGELLIVIEWFYFTELFSSCGCACCCSVTVTSVNGSKGGWVGVMACARCTQNINDEHV